MADSAYLWFQRGETEPITDVKVVIEGESEQPGEGYSKVEGNINQNGSKPVHLYVKTGNAEDGDDAALIGIKVVTKDEVDPAGYTRIEPHLNPEIDDGSAQEFIVIQRRESTAVKKTKKGHSVGDELDVLDNNTWRTAEIIAMDAETGAIKIHFDGWSSKWDEWISVSAFPKKVAALGERTKGNYTGQNSRVRTPAYNIKEHLEDCQKAYQALTRLVDSDWSELTDEEESFLFSTNNNSNFEVLKSLLNARIQGDDTPELINYVQSYLQKNLDMIIKNLSDDHTPVLPILINNLTRIFGNNTSGNNYFGARNHFYDNYGVSANAICGGKIAVRPDTGLNTNASPVSAYLINNIDYFGEAGGFKAITSRILSSAIPATTATAGGDDEKASDDNNVPVNNFSLAVALLKIVSTVYPKLTKDFAVSMAESLDLMKIVPNAIHNITDDEFRNLDTDFVSALSDDVTKVLRVVHGEAAIAEFVEKLNLDLALRMITSDVLEKRLGGVNELIKVVDSIEYAENPHHEAHNNQQVSGMRTLMGPFRPLRYTGFGNGSAMSIKPTIKKAEYLTAESMIMWLEQHNVVNTLLKSHEQIIKRSPKVLKFLAKHKKLSVAHIEMLWSTTASKQETLVRIVYDTIGDLAQALSEEQNDALYARMSDSGFQDVKDYDLNFIKLFTMNAVKATKGKKKWYGTDVFWQMVQDDFKGDVNEEVKHQSFMMLKELLSQHQFAELRNEYMIKCIEGIRSGNSVIQSMQLAKIIIELVLKLDSDKGSEWLASLHKEFGIVALIFDELKTYFSRARPGYERKLSDPSSLVDEKGQPIRDHYTLCLVGKHCHALQLHTRLDFLHFIIVYSGLRLVNEDIDKLWASFVTTRVMEDDSDRIFNWMTNVITPSQNNKPPKVFDSDAIGYAFAKLSDPPVGYGVTLNWYQAFETFFCYINYYNTEALTSANPRRIAIINFQNIVGLDTLWKMPRLAVNSAVADKAQDFLVTVHLRLDFNLTTEEKKEILGNYVISSMDTLGDVCHEMKDQKVSGDSEKEYINQLVSGLSSFIDRIESGEMMRRPLFFAGENVRAWWKSMRNTKYLAKVEEVNVDGTYKVRYSDGDYDPICPETNLFTQDHDRKEQVAATSDDEEKYYPRKILSSEDKYFDLLLDVLGLGGDIGPKVWALLLRLPTNETLQAKISGLVNETGDIAWDSILPAESIIKLLYTLQIVANNIGIIPQLGGEKTPTPSMSNTPPPNANSPASLLAETWRKMFLTKGGFAHVYGIFVSTNLDQMLDGQLPQESLALMLEIINHFLLSHTDSKLATDSVEYNSLTEKLADIVESVLLIDFTPDPQNNEEWNRARVYETIVKSSLQLFVACVLNNPSLLETCYGFKAWKTILGKSLISHGNPLVRGAVKNSILKFVIEFDRFASHGRLDAGLSPRRKFVPILSTVLSQIDSKQDAHTCTEYFSLFAKLMDVTGETGLTDIEAFAQELASLVINHPILETSDTEFDAMLIGLLIVARIVVKRTPALQQTMGELLSKQCVSFLFDVPKPTLESRQKGGAVAPKCKSPGSRDACFKLLAELANGSENASTVFASLTPNHLQTHSGGKDLREWQFVCKKKEVKARSGYSGLKNLGCICYMNAAMQQLFMIPKLRHNLLAIDSYKEDNHNEDMVYQLQYILSHLQESEQQFVNPKPFTNVWMDEFGEKPIDVTKQEDSGDFITRLIGRVESRLKGTRHINCFKDVLRGTFSQQLMGTSECKHFKEREDEYYSLSLEVKNKRTLEESLEAFVQGDLLAGDNKFNCDACGKKVDTLKRGCIKTLPPTLCITLKRFDLDYNTFQTIKINDRIEFPMELDMYPYTAEALGKPEGAIVVTDTSTKKDDKDGADGADEGKKPEKKEPEAKKEANKDGESDKAPEKEVPLHPREYYQYKLKGMVIHTGSAHGGHYYSYIQERLVDDSPKTNSSNKDAEYSDGSWFKFNDRSVTPFNPEHIPMEAFGQSKKDKMGWGGTSAYILFYDRVKPTLNVASEAPPAVAAAASAADGAAAGGDAPASDLSFAGAVQAVKAGMKLMTESEEARALVRVPPKIFNDIWEQNIIYWRDKAVFDTMYFEFMWKVLGTSANKIFQAQAVELKSTSADEKEQKDQKFQAQQALYTQIKANGGFEEPVDAHDALTRLATRFVLMTLARFANKDSMPQWAGLLKRLYKENLASSMWLLHKMARQAKGQVTWLKTYVFDCPNKETRKMVAGIVSIAMEVVTPYEQESYHTLTQLSLPSGSSSTPSSPVNGSVAVDDSVAVRESRGFVVDLIDVLFALLGPTAHFTNKWNTYYKILANYTALGEREVTYLLNQELIGKLVDIYLGEDSPHNLAGVAVDSFGRRKRAKKPDLTEFLKAIANCLSVESYELSDISKEMLYSSSFMECLLMDGTTYMKAESIVKLLTFICNDNKQVSTMVIELISMSFDRLNSEQIRPLFRALNGLVLIEDSLQEQRVDWIMKMLLRVMEEHKMFWRYTDFCMDHLIRLAKKSALVFAWMHEHHQIWEWMVKWLQDYPSRRDAGDLRVDKDRGGKERLRYHQEFQTYTQSSQYTHYGLSSKAKKITLAVIKEGQNIGSNNCDDSDIELHDRSFSVGDVLDVLDTDLKWLLAEVTVVMKHRVRVHYIDYSDRWDEWVEITSPRLAPKNKFSDLEPQENNNNQQQSQSRGNPWHC